MELKTGELRVHYQCEYEINLELEKVLEKALAQHGYRRWARGYDLTNGVRDLAFTQDLKGLGRDLEREAMEEAPEDPEVKPEIVDTPISTFSPDPGFQASAGGGAGVAYW